MVDAAPEDAMMAQSQAVVVVVDELWEPIELVRVCH